VPQSSAPGDTDCRAGDDIDAATTATGWSPTSRCPSPYWRQRWPPRWTR